MNINFVRIEQRNMTYFFFICKRFNETCKHSQYKQYISSFLKMCGKQLLSSELFISEDSIYTLNGTQFHIFRYSY